MDNDTVLDLEVDVNGEEVFMLNNRILCRFSGRFDALLSKSKSGIRKKVIFNDFPGGAANFELVARFCYNEGQVDINPYNISHLIFAAHFLEMNKISSEKENLCDQTKKSLEEISSWTWSDLMIALKHCQELQQNTVTSSLTVLDKFLDFIIERILLHYETSPSPSMSSTDSSAFRLSCDSMSIGSPKDGIFHPKSTWWFKDLLALNTNSVKMFVKLMVLRNFDCAILSRFLFFYQKLKCDFMSTQDQKIEIIDMVVEMLYSFDIKCISLKSLFRMLRVRRIINSSQTCKDKLENMIGLLLDQATLDDLLVPCQDRVKYLYDVNLILRLLKSFIGKGVCHVPLSRLKKVASLMDLYLAEVAPDPYLKPSKFLALIRAIPGSARESNDGLYLAISMYLKVHSGLSEEERMKICFELSYDKLSSEAFNHLMQNRNFPLEVHVEALFLRQRRLKSLLHETNQEATFADSIQTVDDKVRKEKLSEQIVLYAKELNLTNENEKIKAHLKGMQWRVEQLEKFCRKMQIQMENTMRSRLSSQNKVKSVPRLCS